ncbi:MAG: hypothetical protein AB1Z16_01490 [Desulfotignum sp.]
MGKMHESMYFSYIFYPVRYIHNIPLLSPEFYMAHGMKATNCFWEYLKKKACIMRKKILFVIVVGLFWSSGVLAGNFPVYQWAPESQTSMHGIHFISGGIGITERQVLDQMAGKYSLKVVLAAKDGHYLSRCYMEIIRADGTKILSTSTDGPWLLADLEPGRYQVKAQYDNTWKNQSVTVSADSLHEVIFNW